MDTKKLPPALLMALGLAGCGSDDDGVVSTGPCLDVAAMTETMPGTTGSTGTGTGTDTDVSTGPCLDVAPMTTSSSSESSGSSSGSESGSDSSGSGSGSESGSGSSGPGVDDRNEVVRSLVGRGILPADVAAKLEGK